MKTHFYPFTDQAKPIPLNFLQALGVPATTVEELERFGAHPAAAPTVKGGSRG